MMMSVLTWIYKKVISIEMNFLTFGEPLSAISIIGKRSLGDTL